MGCSGQGRASGGNWDKPDQRLLAIAGDVTEPLLPNREQQVQGILVRVVLRPANTSYGLRGSAENHCNHNRLNPFSPRSAAGYRKEIYPSMWFTETTEEQVRPRVASP